MKKLLLLLTVTLTAALADAGQKEKPCPRLGYSYKAIAGYLHSAGRAFYGLVEWQWRSGESMDCKFDNGVLQAAFFTNPKQYSAQQACNILENMSNEAGASWQLVKRTENTLVYRTDDGVFAGCISIDLKSVSIAYLAYAQNVQLDGSPRERKENVPPQDGVTGNKYTGPDLGEHQKAIAWGGPTDKKAIA